MTDNTTAAKVSALGDQEAYGTTGHAKQASAGELPGAFACAGAASSAAFALAVAYQI